MRERVDVVVPAYREGAGISNTIQTLSSVLQAAGVDYEIIIVDDGSPDDTFAVVQEAARRNHRVRGLRFSRNFGKEAALLAGLKASSGQAVITIDADLQHPPAVIPQMLDEWRRGAKVVNGVKRVRGEESALATLRANLFNAVLTRLGGVDTRNSSDFKLLDRVAVDVLIEQMPERCRFYRGLSDWIGFQSATVRFDVAPRGAGSSSWNIRSLIGLALTALVSFTSAPLRIVTVLGMIAMTIGFGVGLDALLSWMRGDAVSGFATIIFTLLIIGSSIMVSLGIIGEYLAKMYEEIKARPNYIVERTCGKATARIEGPSAPVPMIEQTTVSERASRAPG